MRGRIAAIVMAALLLLYLVVVAQLAFRLIAVDSGVARALGVALVVLPMIGAWTLVVELRFGIRSERLVRRLREAGELPADTLPKLTSGRPVRSAADAEFPRYKAGVRFDLGSVSPTTRAATGVARGSRSGARSSSSAAPAGTAPSPGSRRLPLRPSHAER
jgi:hypothetical protein